MARRPHSNAFPGTSTTIIRRRISEWIIIIQGNVKEQAVKRATCSCHLPFVVAIQEICFSLFISTRSFEIVLTREMICWLREVASWTVQFQDFLKKFMYLWRKNFAEWFSRKYFQFSMEISGVICREKISSEQIILACTWHKFFEPITVFFHNPNCFTDDLFNRRSALLNFIDLHRNPQPSS